MGTYRQPASLVDTQSGKISRQATKEGFAAISKVAAISIAQAEKREKKAKEMENAEKRIWEAAAIAQGKGNALLDKNKIDGASLGTGISSVINEQANARIENLRLSTSDPRYQENLKIIGSTQQFIEGLPSMLEGGVYMESMMQDAIANGVGNKPGQIAFGSMTAAELEANSQTSRVDLGWATSFETVKDENGNYGLYTVAKKGNDTVRNAINYIPKDEDGSTQYNFGTYRIVPDASSETKNILIKDKTFKADGTPSDQYLVKTQETIGNEVYDITRINTDQLLNQSNIPASVIGQKIISNGTESMVDYMQSKGILDPNNPDPKGRIRGFLPYKVDASGNVVKENGKVVFDEWVQVTDDNGQFVQDATQYKANTGHLSDEQYDKFMQFVEVATAADNGVFAPEKRVLDGAATERLKKSRASTDKGYKPTDTQLKATKTQGTIDRAFENLKSNVAEIRKIKTAKSGFPVKASDIDEKEIIDAFRKEMGGLITKGLNFKIEDGKFIPFKETMRAGKEKGETTIIENPILEEGYNIFTEMDKIKTYLEEEFIPIEVKTEPASPPLIYGPYSNTISTGNKLY